VGEEKLLIVRQGVNHATVATAPHATPGGEMWQRNGHVSPLSFLRGTFMPLDICNKHSINTP
jgi:hypothetical protein